MFQGGFEKFKELWNLRKFMKFEEYTNLNLLELVSGKIYAFIRFTQII